MEKWRLTLSPKPSADQDEDEELLVSEGSLIWKGYNAISKIYRPSLCHSDFTLSPHLQGQYAHSTSDF